MPVERGLFVPQTGTSPNFQGTNPTQARLALAGLLAENAAGVPRQGLLRPSTTLVVTGTNDMSYNIAPINPVITRAAAAGTYVFTTTGTTNRRTTPAPGANSRYDIIWAKQNDTQFGDADNTAEIYVTQGSPAATPTKPVPTLNNAPVQGALVLAEVLVPTGATATNSAAVQITQVWRHTAARGAPIPVRSQAERDEIALNAFAVVRRLDLPGQPEEYSDGNAWISPDPFIDIGIGNARPIMKSLEVAVVLDQYLVGTITFPTPYPTALARVPSLMRNSNDATQTTFNVLSNSMSRTGFRFVAGGSVSAGATIYVTYQCWGY